MNRWSAADDSARGATGRVWFGSALLALLAHGMLLLATLRPWFAAQPAAQGPLWLDLAPIEAASTPPPKRAPPAVSAHAQVAAGPPPMPTVPQPAAPAPEQPTRAAFERSPAPAQAKAMNTAPATAEEVHSEGDARRTAFPPLAGPASRRRTAHFATVAQHRIPSRRAKMMEATPTVRLSRRAIRSGVMRARPAAPDRTSRAAPAAPSAPGAYASVLLAAIRSRVRFPEAARREGLFGSTRIVLVVGARGNVVSARIVGSSGSSLLDEAALTAVRSVMAPPPPGGRFVATAPINFSLEPK